MTTKLELNEAQFTHLMSIESHCTSVEISNSLEMEVDAEALIKHLKQVTGTDRIEKLIINYNSSLEDLSILQAFTNLKILYVYGQYIKTFDGIEWFTKGEYIQVQTHRNRRRDISKLSQTKVERMDIYVERMEDYLSAANCENLKKIELYHSAIEPDFIEWKKSSVEEMSFKSCKFKEMGDTALVSRLTKLNVRGCRSFERFKGDNSNIKRLEVDNCRKLDMSTLRTFSGAEALLANSCTQEFNLTDIGRLENVKHLSFMLCNVEVDLINLKDYYPNQESLHISKIKKDFGLQLKRLNPDIKITSSSFEL